MSVHYFTIEKDSTDVSLDVFAQDSTDGTPLTGLAYNTASLTCYYKRGNGGTATALSLVTQTATGAHTDRGFVEISSTNFEGVYRLDLPDAVVATGVDRVTIVLRGAANMQPIVINLDLVDAVTVTGGRVSADMTAISGDSVAADNLESYCDGTTPQPVNATQISGDGTAADNLEAAFDGTGYDLGGIDVSELNAIVDDLINGGRLDLLIDAIKAKTDSLTFTVANQVDANIQYINDAVVTGDGNGTPWDSGAA